MQLANVLKKNTELLRPAKKVDADILAPRLVFIICVLALILFGLVMVFSASNVEALDHNESPFSYLLKQLLFCGFGIFAAIAVWRWIPFSVWRGKTLWICCGVLSLLMLITLIGGTDILGARRWIYVGGVSFQPSEFAKIILVLIVARYYAEFKIGHITFGRCVLIAGGLSVIMIAFILVGQSDLGTSIVCVVGILAVLWIAGIPKWFFFTLVAVCVFGAIGVVIFSGWRSNRMVFLDPWNDGLDGYGAGYQLIRSMYALSEGGIAGVGLGNSYEKYQYLPEAETDFIYSIVGEELGFIGCILVLVIFIVFLISGMKIVYKSKSRFAASMSGAFIVMIVFQALLNIMCVVGLAPTTGKPLPFISAGGSSLIATLIMVGFVLAASEYEAMPDEYERRRSSFKASGNIEGEVAYKDADEIIDEEIHKRLKKIKQRATQGVKTIPKAEAVKVKSTNVKEPKFISENNKQRSTTRQRTTTPNKQPMKSSQRRPSVSKTKTSTTKNSYAYRRSNSQPSFKPSSSALNNKRGKR